MNAQGRPPLGRCGFIESTPLEGCGHAPSPWWWCLLVVCVVSWRHKLIVCKIWYKNNPKEGLKTLLFDPPTLAPHHQYCSIQTHILQVRVILRFISAIISFHSAHDACDHFTVDPVVVNWRNICCHTLITFSVRKWCKERNHSWINSQINYHTFSW